MRENRGNQLHLSREHHLNEQASTYSCGKNLSSLAKWYRAVIILWECLYTACTKDIWLCAGGPQGGGWYGPEGSEADGLHSAAGDEEVQSVGESASSASSAARMASRLRDWAHESSTFPLLNVRQSSMKTKSFMAFVLRLRYLKSTSICSRCLTPVTGVETSTELSPMQPGNVHTPTSTFWTVFTPWSGVNFVNLYNLPWFAFRWTWLLTIVKKKFSVKKTF